MRPTARDNGAAKVGISRRGPSRRSNVDAFRAMDVMRRAGELEAAGRSIVRMEVGQPADGAPAAARGAVRSALEQPLGYTVALGLPELRRAIAARYARVDGVEIDPERIIVTAGSSAGFQLAFLALFDVGDRIALGEPGYPSYRQIAAAHGLAPVRIEMGAETGWAPTPDRIASAGGADGLLVASPANPTGALTPEPAMRALVAWASAENAALISDEIYHGLTFERPAETALKLSDDVVVLNSFSKYHGMTGWRVGWMVVPERLIRPVERLAQNLFICPPHIAQVAALAALSPEADRELDDRRAAYASNRRLLLDALPRMGLAPIAPADGAFYAYLDVSRFGLDSGAFCSRLLEEGGVAATPGYDFDAVRGGATVRLSYAGAQDDVLLGLERLERFVGAI